MPATSGEAAANDGVKRRRRRKDHPYYWGYLYHLDAMQGVSFQDLNIDGVMYVSTGVNLRRPAEGRREDDTQGGGKRRAESMEQF